jgi:hypothetical protein
MLSTQYYPFGCQNGQHSSLRIRPDTSPEIPFPMLSVHAVHPAVHPAVQSSFQAQNTTTTATWGFSCWVRLASFVNLRLRAEEGIDSLIRSISVNAAGAPVFS